jgi:hypothetical protein
MFEDGGRVITCVEERRSGRDRVGHAVPARDHELEHDFVRRLSQLLFKVLDGEGNNELFR